MERAVKRPTRLFPKATDSEQARKEAIEGTTPEETHKRSWAGTQRICAANYAAVEIHGFYGLIDDGSEGAGRMLILHVPRWVKSYFMDIRQGDTLHVYRCCRQAGTGTTGRGGRCPLAPSAFQSTNGCGSSRSCIPLCTKSAKNHEHRHYLRDLLSFPRNILHVQGKPVHCKQRRTATAQKADGGSVLPRRDAKRESGLCQVRGHPVLS